MNAIDWDVDTAGDDDIGAAFEALFEDDTTETEADEDDMFPGVEDVLGGDDGAPVSGQKRSEEDDAFLAKALEPANPPRPAVLPKPPLTLAAASAPPPANTPKAQSETASVSQFASIRTAASDTAAHKPLEASPSNRALARIPRQTPPEDSDNIAMDDGFWGDDLLADGPPEGMDDEWQDEWSSEGDADWTSDGPPPPSAPPADPLDPKLKSDLEMLLAPSPETSKPKPDQSSAVAKPIVPKVPGKIPDHLAPVPAPPAAPVPEKVKGKREIQSAPKNQELDRALERAGISPRRKTRVWAWIVWLAILLGLTYVAFLPYQYEVGGEFTIQSNQQTQVRARTTGEIIELNVSEGDWVEKDQVLAVLSNWDEERDVAVRRADLEALKANLETLKTGAKPEEIALAEEQVSIAEVQVGIAREDLDRKEKLFESETISAASRDDSANALAVAQAGLEAARASLALVRTGALSSEIDALEAAIKRGEEELAFSELTYDQTFVRAVSDGQIVSSLAEVPVGAFLAEGALFAVLEENRFVKAQIEVPESEITEVEIGAVAELRLWSSADVSLEGVVERIAPVAEEREFGQVVRVVVRLPNPDGTLTSNITGYGKIYAREAPVWEVFTRMIFRFFRIELWSWIP